MQCCQCAPHPPQPPANPFSFPWFSLTVTLTDVPEPCFTQHTCPAGVMAGRTHVELSPVRPPATQISVLGCQQNPIGRSSALAQEYKAECSAFINTKSTYYLFFLFPAVCAVSCYFTLCSNETETREQIMTHKFDLLLARNI